MTFVLYRIYDGAGELLYVGRTKDPSARIKTHEGDKTWWRQVCAIGLEHYDTAEELEQAEITAIREEHPRYNIQFARNSETRALLRAINA